eukprot:gene1608-1948_t
MPYIISTKWGTAATAKVASKLLPGQVILQQLCLGWTQPVVVQGISVYEQQDTSSRKLITLEKLTSAEPLYKVLEQRGLTLTLSEPAIDCSLDDQGEVPRLLKFLESEHWLKWLVVRWVKVVAGDFGLFPRSRRRAAGSSSAPEQQGDQQHREVEVWSGPLHVLIESPGHYVTRRVDMIIGSGSSGLHMALWGQVNTLSNTLDMTLGLPASTLARTLGIKHLPQTYMLPISISGQLVKPQIDWGTAGERPDSSIMM